MLDKVFPAVQKALNSNGDVVIPNHLRDELSLALISNVVLFGGNPINRSDLYTDEIVDIGLRIFREITPEGIKLGKIKKDINDNGTPLPQNEKLLDNTKIKN